MLRWRLLLALLAGLSWSAGLARVAASPFSEGTEPERERAAQWSARFYNPEPGRPETVSALPFSFVYGSQKSADLLPHWKRTSDFTSITWTDPKTGLEVLAEMARYYDFVALEWVLHFKNGGTADTPILENVLPLDVSLPPGSLTVRPPLLRYSKGALCCIDDFAPVEKPLVPGTDLRLQPGGGRSSSEVLPFFNVDFGSQGIVLGIGWTGEWSAAFSRDREGNVVVKAGMARTHLKLHPGEEIRTPRILVLSWGTDWMRGNNLLRRFLLTHHRRGGHRVQGIPRREEAPMPIASPKPDNGPFVLPVLVGSWGGSPAAEHLKTIDRIVRRDLPVDLYWIDAEWFGGAPWFGYPGNWEVRKDLYPQGFKAISDPLHRSGRKLLLWFEPQRVCRGTPWAQFKDRPGWLLELKGGNPKYKQRNMNWGVPHEDPRWIERESHRSQICEGDMVWNMGNPDARKFLTDWLSDRIREFGLDWYREDFNIAPLEYWQEADAQDRQGMTEIRFVEGLYTMWDDLLRRFPHLAIDNCSSGGRRIDLETIGRATALWRTDWPADAIHRQCHTFGLMHWVPLHMSDGPVLAKGAEYEIRSAMTAGLNVKLSPQDDEESNRQAKRLIEQYVSIQKYYYGDFYPLTPYSQSADAWMAYQLDLPNEGLVVVLKRPASAKSSEVLRLHGLARDADYELTNLDTGTKEIVPGARLAAQGLEVRLAGKPDSALIQYRLNARH